MAGMFASIPTLLQRDGMIRVAAVTSYIVSSNTYHGLTSHPLESLFDALVLGGIGGGIIEKLTPPLLRPFVCCGLFFLSVATMIGRSMGWLPPLRVRKIKNKNNE
jgi:hypothetical protein